MARSSSSEGKVASALTPSTFEGRLAHGAAEEHEFLVILGESHGGLGRRHRIARIGDQGRPLEKGADRGDVRAFESNLGEAVLGDLNARASLPHLLAQTLHLGDRQAGIVRHDDHRSLRKDLVKRRDRLLLLRSIHGAFSGWREHLPPIAHAAPRAARGVAAATCACPRSRAMSPPPDRRFEPKITEPLDRAAQRKLGLPRLCRPPRPRRSREGIKRRPHEAGRTRRQSRTGHGRTRHEGKPPCPPAYPPLSARKSPMTSDQPNEAEAKNDHKGRIAPPTPARCLSGSGASAKRLHKILCCGAMCAQRPGPQVTDRIGYANPQAARAVPASRAEREVEI